MNRDALLATLIGFGIGLLITGILLLGPGLAKSFPHINFPKFSFENKKTTRPSPTPTPTPQTLTIDSPTPESIEGKNEVLVSGKSFPNSVVLVGGPLDEDVVNVSASGTYAGKVLLSEGVNDIQVTSYLSGNATSQSVTVYYTPEDF